MDHSGSHPGGHKMRRYNVGILGCGVISRTYLSDIKNFYPKLNVISCADVTKELAEKLAGEFDIDRAYTTDDLLADSEVEIVIDLTPPKFHRELNEKIIRSGRHLFSEKPFAGSMEDAAAVIALAKDHNVYAGSAPDTFLSSGLQSVRHYLDDGIIGTPFMVSANMMSFGVETWHPSPAPFYAHDNGPVFDMGPYYISAIVSLLGPIESIMSFSSKPFETRHVYKGKDAGSDITSDVDTTCASILRLKSGVIANLNISYDIFKSDLPLFEIFGDSGTISYPDPNFGGGRPKLYRKEQLLDPVFNDSEGAAERNKTFVELPELFPRYKDYSRGLGVYDLAYSIEEGLEPRTGGDFVIHVTEALCGIRRSGKTGQIYKMTTTCARPEKTKKGGTVERD